MPVGWLRQREDDRVLWRVIAELIMVTAGGVPHSVASLVRCLLVRNPVVDEQLNRIERFRAAAVTPCHWQ